MSPPSHTIYAVIPVHTSVLHPSAVNLQWTADGQLIVVTKTDVYVLTPELGINFDLQHTARYPPPSGAPMAEDAVALGFFQTMIEVDKGTFHHWPIECHDWAAVALGSLDVSIRSVAVSPSGLTPQSRCAVAVLNSNLELSLWHAVKNHLRGEWRKIEDVTGLLKRAATSEEASPAAFALRVQTTAISWSHQTESGLNPEPASNSSLLAAATRSGDVNLLSYGRGGEKLEVIQVIGAEKGEAEAWISHLAWTPWAPPNIGSSIAFLAYACTDGSVRLLRVVQTLVPAASQQLLCPDNETSFAVEAQQAVPCAPDGRAISALSWIALPGGHCVLVFGKPGTVFLWSAPSDRLGWSGLCILHLRTRRLSADSSALHPISGICLVPETDALAVSLQDGSFYLIQNLSTAPTLDESTTQNGMPSSDQVSTIARAIFDRTASGDSKHATKAPEIDANRINGMVGFDHGSVAAWLQEDARPSDFSYKHDAKRTSKLVMAEIFGPRSSEQVLSSLTHLLKNPGSAWGRAPIALLRPTFLHFQTTGAAETSLPQLLALLKPPAKYDWNPPPVPAHAGGITPELRRTFRTSLASHLFGSAELWGLRLRLGVASFLQTKIPAGPASLSMAQVVETLLNTISLRILHTLVRHLAAVLSVLTPNDVPFVMRVVVQSLLPGKPLALAAEAQALADATSARLSADTAVPAAQGFEELCPACGTLISLSSVADARCARGHAWGRCSVTSFVLSTPHARTCVGCVRKAFLPTSSGLAGNGSRLPPAAGSWAVEELLAAARSCLFCGNAFVTLV